MKKYIRLFPAMVCMLLIIALVLYHSFGLSDRTWDRMQDTRMVFPAGKELSGDAYGVMNSGPSLTLPGGMYTLHWDIESDGENEIRIETTNGAALTPSVVTLEEGKSVGNIQIHAIDELYDLQLLINYRDGTYIRVNNLRLTGGACTDNSFTLAFLLAGAALLNILAVRGWLTPERRTELVVLLGAVLLVSIPCLKDTLNTGHDFSFHVDRLLNMLNALRTGQFPARLGAYMQNRYGAVTSVFYPELFMYIPAGMMLCGASLIYSMHVLIIGINLVTAFSMRYCAGRLFKSAKAGVFASLLYVFSAYRVMDLYTRFSLGEVMAMAFIPLFIAALYDVVLGDKRKWKLLAVSAVAIYQSHLISTVICGLAAVALCVCFAFRIIREKRWMPLVLAAVTALLLCLYALVPLMTHSRNGVATNMMLRWTPEHLLAPAQLFLDAAIPLTKPMDGALKEYPTVLGLPIVLGALAALMAVVSVRKQEREDKTALVLLLAGAGFALMTTTLFPWERLTQLSGLVGYIQFPWRLLAMATVCFSIAGGYGLAKLTQEKESAWQLAVFAVCALTVLPLLTQEVRKDSYLQPNRVPAWDMLYEDYTLEGTVIGEVRDASVHTFGEIDMQAYEKVGTNISADVHASTDSQIAFPLFAFDGYAAELNGERIDVERGENNRLTVSLSAGSDGELRIWYEGKRIWRICDMISLLAAVALLASYLPKKRIKNRRAA